MMVEEPRARNQALFRDVNERIQDVATDFRVTDEASFVCECADIGCTQMVSLTLTEYEHVRINPRRFAVLPDHVDPAIERLVEQNDRYVVVEKIGAAAKVAERLDPRVAERLDSRDPE